MKFVEVTTRRGHKLTLNPLDIGCVCTAELADQCIVFTRGDFKEISPLDVAESRESLTARLNEAVRDD